ncbi:transposase [Streptomyces sp. GS7]|nr:transposase [Streptomyces sp. GS7]
MKLTRPRVRLSESGSATSDSRCRPLAFHLTPGQAGDAPAFMQVMARLRIPRPIGRSGTGTAPDMVLADKAHSSRAFREHLRRRIRAAIPQPADQTAHGKRAAGGPEADRPPSTATPTSRATPRSATSTA